MEAYDLAHKLAYAGSRSPVPFITGPEYMNSVPGVPVCSMLRIFIPRDRWSDDNVMIVAREVCRVLGAGAQFDIGIAVGGVALYDPEVGASGETARLMKLAPKEPTVMLRLRGQYGDRAFQASFPRLKFEPTGEDFWRSFYAPGAVKDVVQL